MKRNILLASCAVAVAALFSACPPIAPEPTIYTESLYERYVERFEPGNAAKGDPDETWLYGADGALLENCVFEFDGQFHTTGIRAYTSATLHDATTLVSRFAFQYDADDNLIRGDIYNMDGGTEVHAGYYTTAYNAQGNYTDFLEYRADGSGGWTVVEHRTSTYDTSGNYYLVESYYSDATTNAASLTESYTCEYDPAVAGRYVKETHYRKIAASPPFESTIIHNFEWDSAGRMYFQTDYLGSDRERSILYTFVPSGGADVYPVDWRSGVDTNKKAVSYFNADGLLVKFESYRYADDGRNIEKLVENYSKVEGERAEAKETYAWSVDPANAAMMFMDQRTYTYGYITRSATGGSSPVPAPASFKRPAPAHR